jgi:protein TonB
MTRNFVSVGTYPKPAGRSWLSARATSETFGKSRPVVRDIAFALSGLAHMVLVMMVLQPSQAVPPAINGKTAKDAFVVTLTDPPRWKPPAAPVQMLAPPEPPALHQQQPDADWRIHHPKPPARQPARLAEANAPVRSLPRAVESIIATLAQPSAPVEILHPRFREPPEPAAYPPKALELNQQGEVLVRARIDCGGNPEAVEVARGSGFPMLDAAALQAVRRWRFMPAEVDGIAVVATVQVPVIFHLQ